MDHNDLRLTPDGRHLLVAGGREVRPWALSAGGEPLRTDVWRELNPAVANRLTLR